MALFIEFVSRLIYGTGAEAVITPNHRDFVATTPSGSAWITRYVAGAGSVLGVFEQWLATNNLPPVYPWDGTDLTPWDPGDPPNVTGGLPLPATLTPTNLSFATQDALGVALRDRLASLQTSNRAGDLQDAVKAPYSHRFWAYLKWAQLIVRRYNGELVDFSPPLLRDRDGTILSAVPFLNFVNSAHWRWHDFNGDHGLPFQGDDPIISPAGPITPGYSSPVGQRAAANATTGAGQRLEFLLFHRDHIQMIHNWLARTGQGQIRSINMLSVFEGWQDPDNRGFPADGAGNPSTWTETYNRPWANTEAQEAAPPPPGGSRLRDFTTPSALAGTAMGTYHAQGHNSNFDIRHPFKNNYNHRFFAWHQFLDKQWFFRAPRFARWNPVTGLAERVFRPVSFAGGAPWPGMNALTIVRDPAAAADAISPPQAVQGADLATGAGTLRMEFVAEDTYDRLLRMNVRADVFNDASSATPVETVNVSRTVGPGGDFAQGTNFTLDLSFTGAFRSSDPARATPAVGFVNNRIRVTATLAPDDGSDAAFAFEDRLDIDLVQEREAPRIDLYLNLGSFGENQVASKAAEPDGTKRFRNALIVTVQDRTVRPVPISWPSTMIEELKNVLAPAVPAAGLFVDAAHAPVPVIWQPSVDAPITGVRVERSSGPQPEDASLPANSPQRFTYTYDVVFDPGHQAFAGLALGGSQTGRLRVGAADRAGNSALEQAPVRFFRAANPYMVDGDPPWLSQDTRVLRIFEGESLFGVTMVGGAPNDFIANLITALNDTATSQATRDAWFQSLPLFAGQDVLEFSTQVRNPATAQVRRIYNFALARVRLQGTDGATGVRAFFRLFTYAASNLIFDGADASATSGSYRTHTDGARKVPLLGFLPGGEVISIPFFAVPRVASSTDMKSQPADTPNVGSYPAGIAAEQLRFFGSYLDINQDSARLPAQRVSDAARRDGGFLAAEVQPIRTTILDAHQCMVVEIQYDDDDTPAGTTPFTSDNLAQRNLAILRSDNPGSEATRTIEHSFAADVRRRCCEKHEELRSPGEVTFLGTKRDAEMDERARRAPQTFHSVHIHQDPDEPEEIVLAAGVPAAAERPHHGGAEGAGTHEVHGRAEGDQSGRLREHEDGDGHDHGNGHDHDHGNGHDHDRVDGDGHGHGNGHDHDHGHDDGHDHDAGHEHAFTLAFDDVDWKATGDVTDELMFVWNGLPEETDVELYLPGVRAEQVLNLRNVRHAPRDVRIRGEHALQLVPSGVTYVPLPPTREGRVVGVVTAKLPEGVRHGQRWEVDVLQIRGPDRSCIGAFRLDVRVDRDREDMAEAELRLLTTLFERRSLRISTDPWAPVLDRRVATARARARALAERAGLDWSDPTQWLDEEGTPHDLAGPRLRVVLDKIEVRRDYDPWIKGAGELSFTARVETPSNGGVFSEVRLPESGVFRLADGQTIELQQTIFSGHADRELRVEIVGREEDLLDPDDWIGKYARVFDCDPDRWFGPYGPEAGVVSPEDVGPWRIWYRIERGGSAD